VLVFLLYIII